MLDCDMFVNGFEPHLRYHIHFRTDTFGKDINPIIRQVRY